MVPLAFLGPFGVQELLIVLLIVVFLFGARKIPEIARGLGEGIRGFRSSLKDGDQGSAETDKGKESSKDAGQ